MESPDEMTMVERVEFEEGKLDEIVVSGGAHLESMGGSDWFLEFFKEDGTSIAIWFQSKSLVKPYMEIRQPTKEPTNA